MKSTMKQKIKQKWDAYPHHVHAFGQILYFEVVTSLWRQKGKIDNADIIKINIFLKSITNTNQIWKTLTINKPSYNHNKYTPIEKQGTAFQNDVIIP